ncbi:MAG: FecR domain-containing protein [Bacteroidetes bacterium]|nr:FecR domain-containing protein [Bacteroidota bacterium]MBL6943855.1 FecR domain-containing protein [Bacteroidales bacterium]
MNKELNIQQLVSYITGNCSKKERELVELWLGTSNENMLLFNEFKMVWDASAPQNASCLIDIDKSWNNFKKQAFFTEETLEENTDVSKGFSLKKVIYYASRVAAMIVILFGLYFLFDNVKSVETHSYTAATAQLDSPFVLPDGSNIIMNKDAKIDYPDRFSSDIRYVDFTGEAFFDIVSNPQKPMVIAADNVRVKVLGTSFNLCNCINNDEITVYLESGKILFYSVDITDGRMLEQIILYPGQKGVYNKNTGLITKHQITDNNHTAWKTGALEFIKAPLPDVIKILEQTYRIKITSHISLDNYLLTARFNNETPESIFESLQIIYGFNYEINSESILIN